MADTMTRGQIQDLVGKFASENPKYRAALLSNPKGTIEKQLNTQLGAMTVKAVADTADTVHVVIPYAAAEGELSDSDLERVAGGKQDITANCLVLGGTAVSQHRDAAEPLIRLLAAASPQDRPQAALQSALRFRRR